MPRELGLFDTDAERGLLAALQHDPTLAWQLAERLRPDMFTAGRGDLYTSLLLAAQAGQTPPKLVDDRPADDPIAAADRVRALAAGRVLAALNKDTGQYIDRLERGTITLAEVLTHIETRTAYARQVHSTGAAGLVAAADLLGGVVAEARRRAAHFAATGSSIMGLPTGFPSLDDKLNGLEPGLVVLAGKPGMGKTTLANLIAAHVAGSGTPALYVTYENSRDNLLLKHLCRLAGEPETDARRGKASPEALAKAAQEFAATAAALYYVEASADTTVETIKAQALQIKRRHDAPRVLVVVDYLQKMAHTAGFDELRANVGAIAAHLRDLSRALDSPVLALASLNRGGYGTAKADPTMAQLKESGDIEYGADVVLLLSDDQQDGPPMGSGKPVKLYIAKNRGGASDTTVPLVFKPAIGDFKEQAPSSTVGMNGANGYRR